VLVPESLAYATIAGVSPVIGLYAAPAALILYAAFGSSRHLVTGPMAATAALSAAAVADLATDDGDFVTFTVVLALVTGLAALIAGLLRLASWPTSSRSRYSRVSSSDSPSRSSSGSFPSSSGSKELRATSSRSSGVG
jgi:hypothetical protein